METTVQNYAQIGNLKMYYEVSGNPNGDWLVLLHGMSASTKSWKYQLEDFNKHFRVLNLDLIGHGKTSSIDSEKYSGVIIANYVRALMDELHIDRAHILGISLGSIIQQYFTQLFPERIISLVFTSPVTKANHITKIFNFSAEKILLKFCSKNTYLKLFSHVMLPGKTHSKSRHFFLREALKMKDQEFYKWIRIAIQGDHYYFLKESNIPTLIIAGDKDFCYFNDSLELKKKFKNCQFKVIKDAGHVLIFQKPKEFNQIVIGFLNSLRTDSYEDEELIA